jgi:hypothetical protein
MRGYSGREKKVKGEGEFMFFPFIAVAKSG